ncbi:VCBS repeat-containing protein, partial [bacterium]|nr:VCBS repeat-containing protein [bacterium]
MKTTRRILFLLLLLTAPSWVSGQINNFVLLDGQDDYISLPGNLSNYTTDGGGTVSMWINPTGPSPTIYYPYEGQTIFADNCGYMGISRGVLGGQDRIWLYNYSNGYYQVGIPYNPDEWTHIAWVLDGSYLKAYKNGLVVDSVSTGPTGYIYCGVNIGSNWGHYSGFLDEVNTWNRAITPAEALTNYVTRLVGNESGLTGLWHFDETGGTVAADSSANGYHAALYNGITFGPPFAPTGLKATSDDQKITLTWNRNTIDNVFQYKVYRDTVPDPVVFVGSTTDTTITFTGLTNLKTYYFRVTTVNILLEESGYAEVNAAPTFFSPVTIAFPDLEDKNVLWGDYDDDGDYDLLVVAGTSNDPGFAAIYKNTAGNFTEQNLGFDARAWGTAASWCDYNNDGKLDVSYTGATGSGNRIFKIYRNNGDGSFSDIPNEIKGVAKGWISWVDIDNDGDQDVAVMGEASTGSESSYIQTQLYRNNGNGTFSPIDAGLAPLSRGSMAWADYDKDGDMDLFMVGTSDGGVSGRSVYLYRNDGYGGTNWSDQTNIAFNESQEGVVAGACAFGDLNNDGYPDIAYTGGTGGARVFKVFINNGIGGFTDQGNSLTGVTKGLISLGDLDNDGDLDMLVAGENTAGSEQGYLDYVTYIALNDGDGDFTMINTGTDQIGGFYRVNASGGWNDFDRDGDLDILIAGENRDVENVIRLYRNTSGGAKNTAPGDPAGLISTVSLDTVRLQWNPSTDGQTPSAGLTYNIRVGSTPAGINIVSPMAKVTGSALGGGFRYVFENGNSSQNTSWMLNGLADGTYYWSVEAIDQNYRNSKFQAEQSFAIDGPPEKITGLVADAGNSAVTLSWNRHSNKSDHRRYYIYTSLDNESYLLSDSSLTTNSLDTTRAITGLDNGQLYYFKVLSVDNAGQLGVLSDYASTTPSASPTTWFVTTTEDTGPGSLRDAIDSANTSAKKDTILFQISRGSVIGIYSGLPPITSNYTVINADSNGDGLPDITINGEPDGRIYDPAITINSSYNVVRGLVIQNCGEMSTGGGAIWISGSDAHDNKILGNYIGTNDSGMFSAYNGYGIWINDGAHDNWIGDGTAAGRNVISGNQQYGIYIDGNYSFSNNNKILGNIIGLSSDGLSAVPNSNYGIYIYHMANNTQIGNATVGGRNIISGNSGYGIYVEDANGSVDGTKVLGNYIGTDITGLSALGNSNNGIYFNGYSGGAQIEASIINSQIGNGTAAGRNVISGNGNRGILFRYQNVHDNSINGNYIGVTADGDAALANQNGGIYIEEGHNNIISNNVVSGNNGTGISIASDYYSEANNNVIKGNKIGTDATGTFAIGNDGYGVHLIGGYGGYGVYNTAIGGASAGEGNVISGNANAGIVLGEGGNGYIENTEILGNFIGTNTAGTAAIPNDGHGIYIYNYNDRYTTIGNGTAGGRNVISGNTQSGIWFEYTSYNTILGNYIGVDASGTGPLPNQFHGIMLSYDASYNRIGDGTVGGRNVVSGNDQSGIWLEYTSYNTVLGNYVGVDATGNEALPNDSCGIVIWNASFNRIGDGTAGGRNVVSANGMEGIELYAGASNSANYNYIGGNHIGIGADGTTALGNVGHGVEIEARDEGDYTYNDTVFANVIAFNGEDGIHMESNSLGGAYNNPLLGNRIFNNGGEGIALENGANYGVQPPVIDSVINFTVYGHGIPYAVVEVHEDGDNEGQFIIGQTTADEFGAWSVPHNVFPGQNITAIQDSVDNTSAFSAPFEVTDGQLASNFASLNFGGILYGDSLSLPVRIWAEGNPAHIIGASFVSANFTLTGSSLPDTLFSNDTTQFVVKLKPGTFGAFTDTLLFTSGGGDFKVAVSGDGLPGTLATTAANYDFGNVYLGDSASFSLKLYTSAGSVDVSSLTSGSSSFITSITPTPPDIIDPGDTTVITVKFRPVALGTARDTIRLLNNSLVSPFEIVLSGSAIPGVLASTSSGINFGGVTVGDSASLNVKVYANFGDIDLSGAAVFIPQLSLTSTPALPALLHAGDTAVITIKYKPEDFTALTDTLRIFNSSLISPFSLAISGMGAGGTLAATSGLLNFGTVIIGDSAVQNVKLYTSSGSVMVNSSFLSFGTNYSVNVNPALP